MEWISVKDRLPKEYEEVLTYSKEGIDTGFLENGIFRFSDEFERRDVTHWMPLPEPPCEHDYADGYKSKHCKKCGKVITVL